MKRIALAAVLVLLTACFNEGQGQHEELRDIAPLDAADAIGSCTPPTAAPQPGTKPLNRLTVYEYNNSVGDLVGDRTNPGTTHLPADSLTPFDNEVIDREGGGDLRAPSTALIEGAEAAAEQVAKALVENTTRRAALVPCATSTTTADDIACLRQFVVSFGRRAYRRPLTATEIDRFLSLQPLAKEAGSFWAGVELVLRTVLQSPKFLYHVELGVPDARFPSTVRLTQHELAARLSYTLWGSTPPTWLLDEAGGGRLTPGAAVRTAAQRLWDTVDTTLPAASQRRAQAHVNRFHALWLGYQLLPGESAALNNALRTETTMMVNKIVFTDRANYMNLFTADYTFMNDLLRTHYGLPTTGAAGFSQQPYGTLPRKGVFGHGAVLGLGAKFVDTSPTVRGLELQERMFCREIPPPPPDVNTDNPPETGGTCNVDKYAAHRAQGSSCQGCHQYLDAIGFGLENYDKTGKFRTADVDKETGLEIPGCTIPGIGTFPGLGEFRQVPGLASLAVESGEVERCIPKQAFRYAMGRYEGTEDDGTVGALTTKFTGNRLFDQLWVELVSDETFAYRRLEETP